MEPTLEAVLAAIASFFLITLVFAVVAVICKSHKARCRKRRHTHHQTRTVPNPVLSSITADESASFDPNLKRISMEELKLATKDFSTDLIIGDGSFGLVYRATLASGVTVAIKKLDPDAFQGFREFRTEMETLGKLRHPNIVKILGYCSSGIDRVLILEFVENGSLDQWLHDMSSRSTSEQLVKPSFTWETRVKVVRGVANGLAYLHGLDTAIIHRDIKASNILLDSNFEAHIADFGLARGIEGSHSHVSTQVAGTMGYMPPEYKEGMPATKKADVYSFGVLMFEVATGERPNLPVVYEGKEVWLIEWAREMLGQNRHMEMLDRKIPDTEEASGDDVKEYFRIALLCTNEIMRDRPEMSEVVDLLKRLSKLGRHEILDCLL